MNRVHLAYNRGFSWEAKPEFCARGYLFDSEGNYYAPGAIAGYFEGEADFKVFRQKVISANGRFSVIRQSGDEIWLAVDPIRIFPLFYTQAADGWHVSDDPDYLAGLHDRPLPDKLAATEFQATGYVTGRDTLISQVKQVQAGEIVRLKMDGIEQGFYFTWMISEERAEDYATLREEGKKIFEEAFRRFIESLDGRTVALPLSGGYDSRLIAAMLKRYGYEKVICFTYGRRSSPEVAVSEKVAGELGYPWLYIEYNDQLIEGFPDSAEFREYFPYSSRLVSMFFMQEYFAVKYMKEKQLIPPDSVFVPGHSGDFLGGSQLFKHRNTKRTEALSAVAERLFRIKYCYLQPDLKSRMMLLNRIRLSLEEKGADDRVLAFSVHEDWDFREKLAKFNFNSVMIYDFFGYQYRLPFWDHSLLGFFRSLPLEFKLNKKLYNDILIHDYFEPLGIRFSSELQATTAQLKVYQRKGIVKRFLPRFVKRWFTTKADNLFYREITSYFIRERKQKGIRIRIHGNSYNSLIIQWYLWQIKEKYNF
ncbi:MAG: asparagine synthase-related protein [Bacteroidota bacterium]